MSFPPALSLSDEARFKIRNFLRKKFFGDGEGSCFFRRFDVLLSSPSKLLEITNHFGPGVSQTLSSLDGIPEKIIKKNVELKYSNFAGFTSSRAIREEPTEYLDKEIYINSNNYCQLDLTLDFTFKFNKVSQLSNPFTPQHGDLIFIFIFNKTVTNNVYPTKKSIKPRADFWCIVSEQFLHAWTLIQYDWHESFDKLISISTPVEKKEATLREKMFSGNRLMTNSWLKYKLATEDSGKTLSIEESKERYWYLRTEYASRKWVDIYAAIVLVGRYGELPCPSNIPNNKSTIPDRCSWNLPDVFMTKFLQKSLEGCEITNHLLNYDKWASYSNAPVMFSFYNNGNIKGFFDDLPTIRLKEDEQKQPIPINNLSIKLSDFSGKIDIKPDQHIEANNSWARIVRNDNNTTTTKKGENIIEKKSTIIIPAEKSENQQDQKLVSTFTLQLNLNIAKNWAEIVHNDGDDW
jgi:hypothetical protein